MIKHGNNNLIGTHWGRNHAAQWRRRGCDSTDTDARVGWFKITRKSFITNNWNLIQSFFLYIYYFFLYKLRPSNCRELYKITVLEVRCKSLYTTVNFFSIHRLRKKMQKHIIICRLSIVYYVVTPKLDSGPQHM